MKISFDINPEQLERALEIAHDNLDFYRRVVEDQTSDWMRKSRFSLLLGLRMPHEGDDSLTLEGLKITYHGTRQEMHEGGVHHLIGRIFDRPLYEIFPSLYLHNDVDQDKRWFEE